MSWLVYALMVCVGAAGIHVFSKLSNGLIGTNLGLVVAMGAAFLSAAVFYIVRGQYAGLQEAQPLGWVYAALVGVCVAVAHLAIFYMYSAQAPLSIAVPIVRMGAVVIVLLVGMLLLGEQLKPVNFAGIRLAVLAVILMSR